MSADLMTRVKDKFATVDGLTSTVVIYSVP